MLNNFREVDIEKWATGRNFLKPFLFKSHPASPRLPPSHKAMADKTPRQAVDKKLDSCFRRNDKKLFLGAEKWLKNRKQRCQKMW